jgi:hypothetical protein
MKLNDLVDKDIRIKFLSAETSDVVGKLSDIDREINVVHVYYNQTDLLVPLYSIKHISEHY